MECLVNWWPGWQWSSDVCLMWVVNWNLWRSYPKRWKTDAKSLCTSYCKWETAYLYYTYQWTNWSHRIDVYYWTFTFIVSVNDDIVMNSDIYNLNGLSCTLWIYWMQVNIPDVQCIYILVYFHALYSVTIKLLNLNRYIHKICTTIYIV